MRLTRGCNWSKISCKRRARGIGDGAEFESARKIWGGNLPPKGSIYGKCIEYVDLHGFLFSMVNLVHVPSITDGAPLGSENYRLSQLPPEICGKCLNHNHQHPRLRQSTLQYTYISQNGTNFSDPVHQWFFDVFCCVLESFEG